MYMRHGTTYLARRHDFCARGSHTLQVLRILGRVPFELDGFINGIILL